MNFETDVHTETEQKTPYTPHPTKFSWQHSIAMLVDVLWIAFIAVLCLGFVLVYVQLFDIGNQNERATTAMMLDGTAYLPFQSRMLIVILARPLITILPPGLVAAAAAHPAIGPAIVAVCAERPDAGLAVLILLYLAMLAYAAGLYYLLAGLGITDWRAHMAVLVTLYMIPLLFSPLSTIYDLPTLAVFTWCYALINIMYARLPAERPFKNRRLLEIWLISMMICFFLACVSKETAILIVFVIIALVVVYPKDTVWTKFDVTVLIVAYIAIRVQLYTDYYFTNPGAPLEYHLPDHLARIAAEPVTFLIHMALIALALAAAMWRWKSKPLFLRCAFPAVVIPLAVLFIPFGFPGEIRAFLEALPLWAALCASTPWRVNNV